MQTPHRSRLRLLRAVRFPCALVAACFVCEATVRADDGTDAERAKQTLKPEEVVREARERLASYDTIEMGVVQATHFRDRANKARGRYWQGTNLRTRLEFNVRVGQVDGRLLQVCDGADLWTQYDVGGETRLTLRRVQPILQAARAHGLTGEQLMKAEIGLGGLPALFRALEESTDFDKIEKRQTDAGTSYVVKGGWTEEFSKAFEEPNIQLFVPHRIEVELDEKLFPLGIVYLRRVEKDGEEELRPIVSLEFNDPVVGEPIDESRFEFTPPTGVFLQDVTDQYVQKLKASPGPPPKQ